ncbi:MBL fold metallo-hydrolase [Alkalihalophilus marmarensis]|nr:MBL fold metallo-hydrolase [Alkalihalophilus marmarensis]MEC2070962.1 MBL fold metallo-hydrolase [Alkalihalophilus marmarensis]
MDKQMSYGDDYKPLPATSLADDVCIQVVPDVFSYTNKIVNLVFIGHPDENEFVLVDAGMPNSAPAIIKACERVYGSGCRPKAIILTHGHFDHVGSIIELLQHWDVSVYAHALEHPYLNGDQQYPEADPTVEGGMLAKLSPLFPNDPINIESHLKPYPADGTVPYLEDFKWVHTPGHSPGHVSLFRENDRTLIVGDAFVTVKQDSLYKTLTQHKEINGPPRYFTTDWSEAYRSVQKLHQLQPEAVITGHGAPMSGRELKENLDKLVQDFKEVYVPDYGKYVKKNDLLH